MALLLSSGFTKHDNNALSKVKLSYLRRGEGNAGGLQVVRVFW